MTDRQEKDIGLELVEEEDENYIDLNHAVEIEGNIDDDAPMDEDQEDGDIIDKRNEAAIDEEGASKVVKDMSFQTISSHRPSSVFTVASHMNKGTNMLTIISGGGDDRAFLHKLDNNNNLSSTVLDHQHTDSVSCVATNESLVSDDLTKTPKYVAVGAYDGNTILYNPDSGQKLHVLDGPTDVEFIAFHPKGGSVSIDFRSYGNTCPSSFSYRFIYYYHYL